MLLEQRRGKNHRCFTLKPPQLRTHKRLRLSTLHPRQVYTRLHLVSSDPGAEAGHVRRFRVRVRPERLPALPHVGRVCREPAEAVLGAAALHHRVSHHEVGVTAFLFRFFLVWYIVCASHSGVSHLLPPSTAACSCWCSPRPTWRLRASGSRSRSAFRWNPTPPWRRADRSISGKLCNLRVIQSMLFFFFIGGMLFTQIWQHQRQETNGNYFVLCR